MGLATERVTAGASSAGGWLARLQLRLRESSPAYILMLPFLILFFVVIAYPFFYSIYLGFFRASLNTVPVFVGLQNYRTLFLDAVFHQALVNTIVFTAVVVVGDTVLALLLAMALNEPLHGRAIFRIAVFLPVMTSWVVVALIWQILFNEQGVVNTMLESVLHLKSQAWFSDGAHAMGVIMAVSIWKDLGYYMIIFLAALQGVPKELKEAAAIDGANRWQSGWHVTVPNLRPVIYFVASIATINSMQLFTQPYIMTQFGPLNATMPIVGLLYRTAFVNLDFGYGSAIGTVLLILLVILSFLNKKISDWMSR